MNESKRKLCSQPWKQMEPAERAARHSDFLDWYHEGLTKLAAELGDRVDEGPSFGRQFFKSDLEDAFLYGVMIGKQLKPRLAEDKS